jgi:sulfide:quinone oxidoreductase
MSHKHQIVIIGGGNAGISVASKLLLKDKSLDIAIIDPADKHYYQTAWTLVGSGVFEIRKTERNQSDVMPNSVKWIQKKVTAFHPQNNTVKFEDGSQISYDYLVVAAGIQLNWDEIKGLKEM